MHCLSQSRPPCRRCGQSHWPQPNGSSLQSPVCRYSVEGKRCSVLVRYVPAPSHLGSASSYARYRHRRLYLLDAHPDHRINSPGRSRRRPYRVFTRQPRSASRWRFLSQRLTSPGRSGPIRHSADRLNSPYPGCTRRASAPRPPPWTPSPRRASNRVESMGRPSPPGWCSPSPSGLDSDGRMGRGTCGCVTNRPLGAAVFGVPPSH